MKPETVKRIIDCFNSIDKKSTEEDEKYLRVKAYDEGSVIFTYRYSTICNIFIKEVLEDCMIHVDKLEHVKALYKEFKGSDVPFSEFKKLTTPYTNPKKNTDEQMQRAFMSKKKTITFDFKLLESLYKSMKDKSTIIRIDLTDRNNEILVSNVSGDISLMGLHNP